MNRDSFLPTQRLTTSVPIAQARPWHENTVTLDSPALEVMTDLCKVKAATISPSAPLQYAEQMMVFQGVRMLFVVTEVPAFEGLVTHTDLHGDKQLRAVHDRKVIYDELCVADVMTELTHIDTIALADLRTAVVGNLVATLKRSGRNHLLVLQAADQGTPSRVRGVISRSQIERQLGSAIDITPIASSFSEIERALS